ncbi:Solute carrier organic anion transporter family member 1B2 [Holothuria leucospilota]|uniref:Solute carrier organic anion transporter family member n=1 Tax=Holothuria leucospilota TaxID=206669 RepID=A0A9Q1HHQ9_HOLLE|nr:Solute carrier organic anion transporter family member 1B2 [Holothuria leucospilota]
MSKANAIYKPVGSQETNEGDEVTTTPRKGIFHSPVFFAAISMVESALGVAAMAYFGACISTIEKRFQLKSSQSGTIVAVNDVIGLIILLFVTHYGKSRHRPRIIGVLNITVAVGSLVHIIPHLIYGIPSALGKDIENTEKQYIPGYCQSSNATEGCTESEQEESGSLLNQAVWLYIGQALSSCYSCIYPLFITYLDDGVNKKTLAVYMGFYFSTFAVGGATGFALSTICLSMPAYIGNADYVNSVKDSDDPRWIGAWWLGFLILGVIQLILAIPHFFFPKYLPERKRKDGDEDEEENEYLAAATDELHIQQEESGIVGFMQGLLKSVWRVVTNPVVFFLILCFIFLSGFISSFPLFGAKYIQYQFGIPPQYAAVMFGAILLPAGVIGNIVGGFVIKRFARTRLQLATIFVIISCTVAMVDPLALVFGCPNKDIAGLTVHYPLETLNGTDTDLGPPDGVDSPCNEDCNCPVLYSPICGADGITYSSPCHAGCFGSKDVESNGRNYTAFVDCACIRAQYTAEDGYSDIGQGVSALEGECTKPCSMFLPYVIAYFVILFLGPMCANPATLLKLRSVSKSDRSMSISVSDITGKLFGFIPGPIYYGAAIDTACLLFQSSCGKTGNCLVYDIEKFRYVFNGITLTLQVLATLCVIACYFTVRCAEKDSRQIIEPVPLKKYPD